MDERVLRKLVQQHFHKTGSARARAILDAWESYRRRFKKVAPPLPPAAFAAPAAIEPVANLQSTGSPT
jgi:glutamate synthase domain-containing protein 3